MLLSLVKSKKQKKTHTHTNTNTQKQQNKHKQQQHTIAPVYITGGDAIRQLLSMINR